MAQIIPSLNTCLKKMTSGEKRLAEAFRKHLEDDYLCWFDIPVGRQRRYPDFIILNPRRGLIFIEVKDWKLDNIKAINPQTVELLTDSGLKHVSHPLIQARQSCYQVLAALEKDPALQQTEGRHKGKLCFPYTYGVYFHNISREAFNASLEESERETVLPGRLCLFREDARNNIDAEAFQTQLWDMFEYTFKRPLTLPQIDRIRWHLFPEIRINAPRQDSFFDDDANVPLEDSLPDIVNIMDLQQELLARSLGDGHRVIHGVAGSGKTLILGYRCLHLAKALNKPILVLCYNITLAAAIRNFMSDRGIDQQVQVYHFHDWCNTQLRTYQSVVQEGEGEYWERAVHSVIQGVEDDQIPRGQYGAVIIDEGHDFEPEWLQLVTQMVDPETDSLLLLYDDAQDIYRKKSALDFSLSSVGIQAKGRTTILKMNYRNSRQIVDFAYRFAKDYFSGSSREEIPLVQPQAAGQSGPSPVVKQRGSLSDEIAYIVRCLKHWTNNGQALNSTVVLYPIKYVGSQMAKALQEAGIGHRLLNENRAKKEFDPNADLIHLMPMPSSKGLEFDTVVLLDASGHRKAGESESDDEVIQAAMRILYVAMTRARKQLLVCYHRENLISKQIAEAVQNDDVDSERRCLKFADA